MRYFAILLSSLLVVLSLGVTSARADVVLAADGAWPRGIHAAPLALSLGWRSPIGSGWSGEIRTSQWSSALSVRRDWDGLGFAGVPLRPALAAGVDLLAAEHGALSRTAGYHLEAGLQMPLRDGAQLELAARWVVRGEDGVQRPQRFASRSLEVTLGFVFRID